MSACDVTGSGRSLRLVAVFYDAVVARWEPGAGGRLTDAALELFAEHGFRNVTVADVASYAGVTERTFYRHFATKEDVLFSDSEEILTLLLNAIDATPESSPAADALRNATGALAAAFQGERAHHRRRVKVVASDPQLVERDLLKQQAWSETIAARLRARGTSAVRATVLATAVTAAFRAAYAQWATDRAARPLVDRVDAAIADLADDLTKLR